MEPKQVFYLYDLPKEIVTSIKINSIFKEKCGVEIAEAVQFRDCRPNPTTGLPSPFQLGLIKLDNSELKKIADGIKYFDINDGSGRIWHCRGLPYDKDLLGPNKL